MKFWLLVLAAGSSAGLLIGLRRSQRPHFSERWWLELQRREGRVGRDSVHLTFPINKAVNEAAGFNTRRLRRRA